MPAFSQHFGRSVAREYRSKKLPAKIARVAAIIVLDALTVASVMVLGAVVFVHLFGL